MVTPNRFLKRVFLKKKKKNESRIFSEKRIITINTGSTTTKSFSSIIIFYFVRRIKGNIKYCPLFVRRCDLIDVICIEVDGAWAL